MVSYYNTPEVGKSKKGGTHLGRQKELQAPLLKVKLHQQRHVIAHIQADLFGERRRLGKV
jgi:hypothetical protein